MDEAGGQDPSLSLLEPSRAGDETLRGLSALPFVATASVSVAEENSIQKLCDLLGPGPFAKVFLFVSPEADLDRICHTISACFSAELVVGCTTAGEISGEGYTEGEIVAVGLPAEHFEAECVFVPDLTQISSLDLIGDLIRKRASMAASRPNWEGEFAFLLVDGLSTREDELTSALSSGLGPLPLFGGSAGDGIRFGETRVIWQGRAVVNAAVVTLIRTSARVRVFNLDHLVPTKRKMVVTEADPSRRIVRQINAEPAALEYARLLGKDPAQLTTFTFAAHPVVVQVGGRHHVRAIQRVDQNGDLIFFSAIDEGLVLTLAEPQDMVTHLDRELTKLAEGGEPAAIIACDCILRRMEALEKQKYGSLSKVLRDHRVVGFSTYGEQWNSMHVNQTMTGVAIYPPADNGK
ncbi:FIST N-terminal domain-containing protein [Thioclava sp. FR2]|uniref:FIST N-terminal domain-containing protein n=1 Tax=Thioclava sp. FR2 TaxID=3445780 RepID=UPI003EBE59E5